MIDPCSQPRAPSCRHDYRHAGLCHPSIVSRCTHYSGRCTHSQGHQLYCLIFSRQNILRSCKQYYLSSRCVSACRGWKLRRLLLIHDFQAKVGEEFLRGAQRCGKLCPLLFWVVSEWARSFIHAHLMQLKQTSPLSSGHSPLNCYPKRPPREDILVT